MSNITIKLVQPLLCIIVYFLILSFIVSERYRAKLSKITQDTIISLSNINHGIGDIRKTVSGT